MTQQIPESDTIRNLLRLYGVELADRQLGDVCTYLRVLMRWNRRINLTAIRDADECVTRHFGESLFLGTSYRLSGHLLDIGSGAGFPGLALKIMFPRLKVTLLEPVAKKRAFLKEVTRQCAFEQVEVRSERIGDYRRITAERFDAATARAVGNVEELSTHAMTLLADTGKLFLWVTTNQSRKLTQAATARSPRWLRELAVPCRSDSVILVGTHDVSRET